MMIPRSRLVPSSSPERFDRKSNNLYESHMGSKSIATQELKKSISLRTLLILIATTFGFILYIIVHSIGPEYWEPVGLKIYSGRDSDYFTIVLNTFKRNDMLENALAHYSKCDYVKYIHVIWCESKLPPEKLIQRFSPLKKPTIYFDVLEDSLNNRFSPLQEGTYTDGIFSVDDDIRVSCQDLKLTHEVWKSNSRSIVGFMPRIHMRGKIAGEYVYRCWWKTWREGAYSIILTKAAFLHHDYFKQYTYSMSKEIKDYVDNIRNCEDLAMQFLISNTSSLPPLYVQVHLSDLGTLGGISTSKNVLLAGHMKSRSQCLNDLTNFYRGMPLIKSHVVVHSASNMWTYSPATWWEYFSSDLWKF